MEEEQPKKSILDVGIDRPQRTSLSQGDRLEEVLERSKDAKQGSIKPLKTYQSDVAEAIKKDNVSVIKIALAEKRRQDKEAFRRNTISTESKKGTVFLIISIVLVVCGIGVLGYFYFSLKDNGDVALLDVSKNLIYAEKNVTISIDSKDYKNIPASIDALKATSLPKASIENIVISTKSRVASSTDTIRIGQRKLTAQEFINLFNSRAPGSFVRSLSDQFMLGIYKDGSSAETFLILQTDSYENAYAGMLDWERNFQRDMGGLFSIPNLSAAPNPVAVSSATSSASASTSAVALQSLGASAFAPKPFEDRVIENRDARILTNQNGKIVFLYSFIDPQTLVLATSMNTLNEVIARTIQAKHSK